MASSRHNAGNFPASVETQQQRIKASQQPQVQRRQAIEQEKLAQQRLKAIEDCKYSSAEELSEESIKFVQDMQIAFSLEKTLAAMDNLDSWKKAPLNIAVTGQSGSGKSTFINTVRGLDASHSDAAKIGTTEQTTEPHPYPHPDNPKLLFWDLPGMGTPKFPRDTYLKDIAFERFDCYIIITSVRFTEDDLWLAKEIVSNKKKFYFIRGKFDIDRYNEKEDSAESFDEEKLIEKIRQDCQEHLKYTGFENAPVFIISNRLNHKDKWDFPVAIERITMDFPENKRQAILLSLNNLSAQTETMLDMKKRCLAERIKTVSMEAALYGLCPLPGFNVLVDYKIISVEKDFYYKQLGISDKTAEEHENEIMKSVKQGMSKVLLASLTSEFIALSLAANAEKKLSSQVLIQVAKVATTTFTSYTLVLDTLEEILETYTDIAKQEVRRKTEEAKNFL